MIELLGRVADRAQLRVFRILDHWEERDGGNNSERDVNWRNKCCIYLGASLAVLPNLAKYIEEKIGIWKGDVVGMDEKLDGLKEKAEELRDCFEEWAGEYDDILDDVMDND